MVVVIQAAVGINTADCLGKEKPRELPRGPWTWGVIHERALSPAAWPLSYGGHREIIRILFRFGEILFAEIH